MERLIKPIKPQRVSDQVFEQLRDLIFRGQLKAGEQLLPERELSQALGVSRPTLREAINKLVSLGLVEHRQGQGTFVGPPAGQKEKNPLAALINGHEPSLEELLEVRLGLECQAAVLAAQRATEQDLAAITKCLDDMQAEHQSGRLGIEEDVSFHMAIAYATKNLAQVYIMRTFYDQLHFGIKENLHHLYTEPGNLAIIDQQHRAVLAAIQRHNPEAAFNAMKLHITFVLNFFRGSALTSPLFQR
jgi:GntR family transcriptional regulator, transcriptional repressor for pyruvate dehydrogenase complex